MLSLIILIQTNGFLQTTPTTSTSGGSLSPSLKRTAFIVSSRKLSVSLGMWHCALDGVRGVVMGGAFNTGCVFRIRVVISSNYSRRGRDGCGLDRRGLFNLLFVFFNDWTSASGITSRDRVGMIGGVSHISGCGLVGC